MRISYDSSVDALYIRLIDEPEECEVIKINDQVSINIGEHEKVVGIEILDASDGRTRPSKAGHVRQEPDRSGYCGIRGAKKGDKYKY